MDMDSSNRAGTPPVYNGGTKAVKRQSTLSLDWAAITHRPLLHRGRRRSTCPFLALSLIVAYQDVARQIVRLTAAYS